MATALFKVDPKIEAFEEHVYDTPLIQDIWKEKYFQQGETQPSDAYRRVAKAIAQSPAETNPKEAEAAFFELMSKRLFLPGGRILAGAGTSKVVTLMNCYVNATLEDSMVGIMQGVSNLALTSQQGGGMGTAFETLRPKNAVLTRTQSAASGVLPFMDVFSQTGKTIRSAGERRAAQMGTISDTHPDLLEYIVAKGNGLKDGTKRLSEFNVSVLISDAFKAAVDDDEEWLLYFHIPPVGPRSEELTSRDFDDDQGTRQYIYSIHKARDLWALITEYTYEFSDPGVIFIDRVNELNNLGYCETIRCTNPCGEQPLPPHGTCNLGALNVANFVRNPFTPKAHFDFDMLAKAARWGLRFLDNVIDVTGYPLPEQREEEMSKRRVGLGLTGLATAFAEMQMKYGGLQSQQLSRQIMKTICLAAYEESMELSRVRGAFPLFKDIIIDYGFIKYNLEDIHEEIVENGLRNGVLLTVAPVGTGSIALGNLPSGLEPDFALEITRKTRKDNTEEFKEYTEVGYTKRFYEFCTKKKDIPDYMVTAKDLTILDHLKVQAAIQEWVDASTSKTINVPVDMPYEEFVEVYELAYSMGLKGTTTYRHSKYRDSILRDASEPVVQKVVGNGKRPYKLKGSTYKLLWPSMSASMYITINYEHEKPREIFFASKDAKFQDWMTALTLLASGIFRISNDPSWIIQELKQVVSTHDTQWNEGKFYGSLPARIAHIIEDDFRENGILEPLEGSAEPTKEAPTIPTGMIGAKCPRCMAPTFYFQEGCGKCSSCGHSAC